MAGLAAVPFVAFAEPALAMAPVITQGQGKPATMTVSGKVTQWKRFDVGGVAGAVACAVVINGTVLLLGLRDNDYCHDLLIAKGAGLTVTLTVIPWQQAGKGVTDDITSMDA